MADREAPGTTSALGSNQAREHWTDEPALMVPAALLDALADRVADRLLAVMPDRPDSYLDTEAAAAYLAAPPDRIYDLVARKAVTVHRDGRRLLFRTADLDAVLTRDECR